MKTKGYTLVELLIAVAVLTVILIISATTFYNLTKKSDLDASRDNIISVLNIARNKALASEGAKQYGVYFDTSTSPDKYILFQGPNYAGRDVSFDEVCDLVSSIEISNISFNGNGDEVVFKRLDGSTDNYGSITIQSLNTSETRTVYIYSSGEISTQPESISEAGRITDSRHIHFDYSRNINTAIETITLTFTDPTTTVNILMDDYTTSVSFDWEDDVDVGGDIQHIRIHTHRLNDVDLGTQFCIHRDRRYNNKALTITISGDGSDSLISYTVDGQESRGTSFYLVTGEAGDPKRQ